MPTYFIFIYLFFFFLQFHKRSSTLSLVLNPSGDKIINQNEIDSSSVPVKSYTFQTLSSHTVSSHLGVFYLESLMFDLSHRLVAILS